MRSLAVLIVLLNTSVAIGWLNDSSAVSVEPDGEVEVGAGGSVISRSTGLHMVRRHVGAAGQLNTILDSGRSTDPRSAAALQRDETAAPIAACPGESDRYGDHKCNHDETHRVCAQLLDSTGQPQSWGSGDFWNITGQTAFKWDDQIRQNNGDSWCICMWATARLIDQVGCDNVHLHCGSSDVAYVMGKYQDGGTDLAPAKDCLQTKCPSEVAGLVAVQEVEVAGEYLFKSTLEKARRVSQTVAAEVPQAVLAMKTNLVLAHMDTLAEACSACESSAPGQACYAGDCGDGTGKFCWNTQTFSGASQCSSSTALIEASNAPSDVSSLSESQLDVQRKRNSVPSGSGAVPLSIVSRLLKYMAVHDNASFAEDNRNFLTNYMNKAVLVGSLFGLLVVSLVTYHVYMKMKVTADQARIKSRTEDRETAAELKRMMRKHSQSSPEADCESTRKLAQKILASQQSIDRGAGSTAVSEGDAGAALGSEANEPTANEGHPGRRTSLKVAEDDI